MQCTACYVKLFIILSRISVSDIEFKYFLPNSGSGVLVFRTGQVGVWWPSRESGWKQREIMLLCIISIWFTWLCLMSLVIKRKLAVLCATAGGGIWRRRLKSLMKIGSDDVSLWSFQFRHLWVWDSVLSPKNVSAEMLKNYGYDRCRRNFFWESYCIRGKVADTSVQ